MQNILQACEGPSGPAASDGQNGLSFATMLSYINAVDKTAVTRVINGIAKIGDVTAPIVHTPNGLRGKKDFPF